MRWSGEVLLQYSNYSKVPHICNIEITEITDFLVNLSVTYMRNFTVPMVPNKRILQFSTKINEKSTQLTHK